MPITLMPKKDSGKPLLFYISGDGGMNHFSQNLVKSLGAQGYPIITLDAKEYFWKKKTQQQATLDVSNLLAKYSSEWNLRSIVFVGYSFGADVVPFIYNGMNAEVKNKIESIVLLSPSQTTDFEIHLTSMFGLGKSDGESVVAQINKITNKKVVILYGSEETDFPKDKLTIKNKEVVVLQGGHHYDGDTVNLAKEILRRIK